MKSVKTGVSRGQSLRVPVTRGPPGSEGFMGLTSAYSSLPTVLVNDRDPALSTGPDLSILKIATLPEKSDFKMDKWDMLISYSTRNPERP